MYVGKCKKHGDFKLYYFHRLGLVEFTPNNECTNTACPECNQEYFDTVVNVQCEKHGICSVTQSNMVVSKGKCPTCFYEELNKQSLDAFIKVYPKLEKGDDNN